MEAGKAGTEAVIVDTEEGIETGMKWTGVELEALTKETGTGKVVT